MRSRCLRLLLWLVLLVFGNAAFAAQRALLVGVSELVNQPQALWLQAPRNDVMLMRDALQKQGFAAADITVLADGVSGSVLPESQAIHDALGRLLAQSRSGDFVFLYFSGHGTRLRDSSKRYQEPDGLSENFLARDVRGTLGSDNVLTGDLRDADFDAWIQAFLARNVFVASVFDTCSANSMTRSSTADSPLIAEGPADDEVRWRGLRTGQLVGAPGPAARVAMARPAAAEPVPRARYVALFASESHQITPELRLPRKSRNARPQGLLTWAVVEALARKPATWRDLFDGVLAIYPPVIDELAQRFPTRELPSPVAEGNLDAPIFANRAQAVSTRPVWRAQRSGDTLVLQAGQLDGLVAQQPLRVLATMEDGTVRSAEGQLSQAYTDKARMAVPPALRELSGAALWNITPLGEPAPVALRVRAEQGLPPGLSLEYPASIIAVGETDGADVRWTGTRLEVLSPSLGAGARPLPADSAAPRRHLEMLARLKWLNQLYTIARDAQFDGFDAVFEVWNGDRLVRSGPAQQAGARLLPLRSGERAVLNVRNATGRSVDLVVVGIDPQGGTRQVYPEDPGETNRFKRGTRDAPAVKRFELPWFNAEGGRLLVLAAPAAPYSAPRLFGAGAVDAVAQVRVRGALQQDSERQTFAAMVHWAGEASSAR
ncbi:putative peptidase [Variovorax paradoxus B4]|uniref:Putative peptidase n=1 Tax=Variovorax paradoxus B4 TaxID=1246301 RepID=T1X6E4_VARPD|nr:caspase family protein [Variovorax paradoxus]AGU47730.1 putative peptidase [Variovorax paradoxus B4]